MLEPENKRKLDEVPPYVSVCLDECTAEEKTAPIPKTKIRYSVVDVAMIWVTEQRAWNKES